MHSHEAVISITKFPPQQNPNRRIYTVSVAIFHTHNPEIAALRRSCNIATGETCPMWSAIRAGALLGQAHCAVLDSKCQS